MQTVVGSATTGYLFNAGGQRVSEWSWNGTTYAQLKGKYYMGGTPVGYYTTDASSAGAATHFEHQDWLGTERLRTTYNGSVESSYTSLPFGDGQTPTDNGTDANHYATLDHDTESDTDHAEFRQYSNLQGRFLSPDSYSGSYNFSNPQSMNRYVYAQNSPMSAIDPSGMDENGGDGTCADGTNNCYPGGPGTSYGTFGGGGSSGFGIGGIGTSSPFNPYDSSIGGSGTGFQNGLVPSVYYGSGTASVPGYILTNGGIFLKLPGENGTDPQTGLLEVTSNLMYIGQLSSWNQGSPSSNNAVSVAPNNGLPTPTSHKLTIPGTNYCGPGGSGTPTNQVDSACATHDACYQNAGVSWRNNVPFGPSMNAAQRGAIQDCDANLCRTLGNMSWPSSAEAGQATLVSTFFGCSGGYSLR